MNNTTELTIIIMNIQHFRSSVGTLYALPWYLTWFGHSLNSYRDVVRLYDYFLASPFLMPLYVTVAIVLYRTDDIFKEDCDMASLHCLLSQVREKFFFGKKNLLICHTFIKPLTFFSVRFSFRRICHSNIYYKAPLFSIKLIHPKKSMSKCRKW